MAEVRKNRMATETHFDLKVICYSPKGSVSEIAEAIVDAACNFENMASQHILSVTRRLDPIAILALKWYGDLKKKDKSNSLHAGRLHQYFTGNNARQVFDRATAELRERDLVRTDYEVGAIPNGDKFGMHATEFGWAVIENNWKELHRNTNGKLQAY